MTTVADERGKLLHPLHPFFRYMGAVDKIPCIPWYGVCWLNAWGHSFTVCPIPFNILAYYTRLLFMWLSWDFAWRLRWLKKARMLSTRAYRRGVADGKAARDDR